MKLCQSVAVLIIDTPGICLVQQQDTGNASFSWVLPGGPMREGELLQEAVERVALQMTGLKVESLGRLVYLVQSHDLVEATFTTTFVLQAVKWSGALLPSSPEHQVLRTELVSLRDAMARLQTARSRAIWEPMVNYLQSRAHTGAVWCYRTDDRGQEHLVSRIDGLGRGFA